MPKLAFVMVVVLALFAWVLADGSRTDDGALQGRVNHAAPVLVEVGAPHLEVATASEDVSEGASERQSVLAGVRSKGWRAYDALRSEALPGADVVFVRVRVVGPDGAALRRVPLMAWTSDSNVRTRHTIARPTDLPTDLSTAPLPAPESIETPSSNGVDEDVPWYASFTNGEGVVELGFARANLERLLGDDVQTVRFATARGFGFCAPAELPLNDLAQLEASEWRPAFGRELPTLARTAGPVLEFTLTVGAPAIISGTVREVDGAVATAEVELMRDDPATGKRVTVAHCTATGAFAFAVSEAGTFELRYRRRFEDEKRTSGYGSTPITVRRPASRATHDIVLAPIRVLRGRLLASDGQPHFGATILAVTADVDTWLDAIGMLYFDLPEHRDDDGATLLRTVTGPNGEFAFEGLHTGAFDVWLDTGETKARRGGALRVNAAPLWPDREPVVLRVPGSSVVVNLTDAKGDALPADEVDPRIGALYNSSGMTRRIPWDVFVLTETQQLRGEFVDGFLRFDGLEPGPLRVVVTRRDAEARIVSVTLARDEVRRLDIAVPQVVGAGALIFNVADFMGRDVADARFFIRSLETGIKSKPYGQKLEDGRVRVELAPGSYAIEVEASTAQHFSNGWEGMTRYALVESGATRMAARVRAGEEQVHHVVLPEGARLRVQVRATEVPTVRPGQSADFVLEAVAADGRIRRLAFPPNEQGSGVSAKPFPTTLAPHVTKTANAIPTGPTTLRVLHAGEVVATRQLNLAPGTTSVVVDVDEW